MNSCEDWLSDGAGLHYAGAGASSSRAVFDRLWRNWWDPRFWRIASAVGQPLNDYFYGQADLFAIAAAYAFHIAQAQAFLDGNKRTAITAALSFLEQNGVPTKTTTTVLYDAMIGIAERRLTKADLAQTFRDLFG